MTAGTEVVMISPKEAFRLLTDTFPTCVKQLAEGEATPNRGFLSTGANIIKQCSENNWRLEQSSINGFRLKNSQRILMVSEEKFGSLFANVCNRIMLSDDSSIKEAVGIIQQRFGDPIHHIAQALLSIFLAHEFFHMAQRLGSDQYEDSDFYINVVTVADYQADLVAIDYVFQQYRLHEDNEDRLYLFFLLVIHNFGMQAFSPSRDAQAQERPTFDRLLVWHFQAARVASGKSCPDFAHPSFYVMPVITFPQLNGAISKTVTITSINEIQAGPEGRFQGIVIALNDARGVIRIWRLMPTSQTRAAALISALLLENFADVRNEFEEIFQTHESILNFSHGSQTERRASMLGNCRSIGLRILNGDLEKAVLNPDSPEVIQYFETIQILWDEGFLNGAGWSEFMRRFPRGIQHAIEALAGQKSSSGRQNNVHAKKTSALIRTEILRAQIRIETTIQDLGDTFT